MPRHDPSEKTKTDILQVAIRLFQEKGWKNVRIEDIVSEVGVTRGAFYHYFKSREELIAAATDQIFLENNPFALAAKNGKGNALEKIRSAMINNLRFNLQNVALMGAVHSTMNNPDVFRSEFFSQIATIAPSIERLLVEGNEDGSTSVLYPKQSAQSFTLLVSMWLNPAIFRVPFKEFCDKISFFEHLGEQLGAPVINDEVKDLFVSLFNSFDKQ